MTTGRMIELAAAVVFLASSVWIYRSQRKSNDGYGSQGAVLLLVIGAIMLAHSLGAFDYHPSKGELEAMQERAR
jgi:hypothetical protein